MEIDTGYFGLFRVKSNQNNKENGHGTYGMESRFQREGQKI
jgi:hypothetical protein